MTFSYSGLAVYEAAAAFAIFANGLAARLPKEWSHAGDQIRRASLSVPLNIAEGSAATTLAGQARYFGIARSSVAECSACLDVLSRAGVVSWADVQKGMAELNRMSAMLRSLIRLRKKKPAPRAPAPPIPRTPP